ncbi:hypothetical protein NPIL_261211 [Nephila pilipes]|uniref:Uncharacterized protein n=1 Tax=Nephila pilipes TaxID=299642 RepID=A0A8X6MJI5_NEPPI|nr:hypothetical protein NPIL_261211 [Nephila pilipes]
MRFSVEDRPHTPFVVMETTFATGDTLLYGIQMKTNCYSDRDNMRVIWKNRNKAFHERMPGCHASPFFCSADKETAPSLRYLKIFLRRLNVV